MEAYEPAEEELEESPLVGSAATRSAVTVPPDVIDGYRILNEIHRGGQGVVYKAAQLSTRREVALKFMLSGPFASRENQRRFRREVELASRLNHPGIVPIFDSGLAHDHYYYVMEYVSGGCLDAYVTEQKLSVPDIIRLFVDVCRAVNYAHQNGVIHRDLKPSNIMVGDEGQPRVLDFGLAKIGGADPSETMPLSLTGQVMGTLRYMSPEQASGAHVECDVRSDVYSLGVILYELLAGRSPYELNRSMAENLWTIKHDPPLQLSTVNTKIDSDLATIVMKALSKEQDRRYQTAGSLGADLSRYLNGEVISARRDSALYVLRKTLERHLILTVMATLFVALAVIAAVVSSVLYVDARNAREAELAVGFELRRERDVAHERSETLRRTLYFSEMNLAGQAMQQPGGVGQVREILEHWQPRIGDSDLRGWEWYCMDAFCRRERMVLEGHVGTVWCVDWSPDGTLVASSTANDHTIRIWNVASGTQVQTIDTVAGRWIDWSPDGTQIASSSFGGPVFIWDVSDGTEVCRLDGHVQGTTVRCIQWDPSGRRLASCCNDGELIIWDAVTQTRQRQIRIDGQRLSALCWNPAGDRIAVAGSGNWHVIDPHTGTETWRSPHLGGGVESVAWSPDSKWVAVSLTEPRILIFETQAYAEVLRVNVRQRGAVRSVRWNTDATALLSAHDDRTIRHWDAKTGQLIQVLAGHVAPIMCAEWSPDGTLIASAGQDSSVRLWNVSPPDQTCVRLSRTGFTTCLDWNSDGLQIATAGNDRQVRVWDAASGSLIRTIDANTELEGNFGAVDNVEFSPDDRRIATIGQDDTVRVFDTGTGEPVLKLRGHEKRSLSVAWHPDGTKLASGGVDGTVRIWRAVSGQQIRMFSAGMAVHGLAWSPDGDRVAFTSSTAERATVTVRSGPSLDDQLTLTGHDLRVNFVRWSADGNHLATGGLDGTVRMWNARSGASLLPPLKHGGNVHCIDWLSDVTNPRLCVANNAGSVGLRDAASGHPILTLRTPYLVVSSVQWSPDRTRLAACCGDRIIVWDATLGYQMAEMKPPTNDRPAEFP